MSEDWLLRPDFAREASTLCGWCTLAHRNAPAPTADNVGVDYTLLLIAVLASVALAIAIGHTILASTIHLMHEGLPCTFHWRPVVLAAALFWFWYLAPAIAESRVATTVIRLVSIEAMHDQTHSPRSRTELSR